MIKKFLLVLLFSMVATIYPKILIITHNYNGPDLVKMQHKMFERFLEDDYEFVVFNDAPSQGMAEQINTACQESGVRCIRIPQEIHTRPYLPRDPGDPLHRPNIRHANVIQYSLDVLGFDHDGVVFIVDSDAFLIRPFNISEYMKDKDIAAYMKMAADPSIQCLCPAMCFLDMGKLPNKRSLSFNCGVINGSVVDSGGWTYFYMKQHPQVKVTWINTLWSHQLFLGDLHINRPADRTVTRPVKVAFYTQNGFTPKEIKFLLQEPDTFEFYLDKHFVHYRGATNYDNMPQSYIDRKKGIFNAFFEDLLRN